MKQDLIKDVVQGMLPYLNNAQCERLQEVLQYTLAKYEVSTGQTELPRDRVKGLELLLPDENALDQFNSVVKPITEFIISNQNENIRLADLRDSLLPKLMSGEIDVSDINF